MLNEIGRLADQMMYYFFGKLYSGQRGMTLAIPAWEGQSWFVLSGSGACSPDVVLDSLPSGLPAAVQRDTATAYQRADVLARGVGECYPIDRTALAKPYPAPPADQLNLIGYFKYHTGHYAPFAELFAQLFQFRPSALARLEEARQLAAPCGHQLVCVHLRSEDYVWAQILPDTQFRVVPLRSYLEWLDGLWGNLSRPRLFVSTTEPARAKQVFARYSPMTSADILLPTGRIHRVLPPTRENLKYLDFYMQTRADFLAIANSGFSRTASMLAANTRTYRPDFQDHDRMVSFDPWNAEFVQIWQANRRQRLRHILGQHGMRVRFPRHAEGCRSWPDGP
ncbi:hypothetical protein ACWDYJ_35345 [Streptomyces sp. NPDC003042]